MLVAATRRTTTNNNDVLRWNPRAMRIISTHSHPTWPESQQFLEKPIANNKKTDAKEEEGDTRLIRRAAATSLLRQCIGKKVPHLASSPSHAAADYTATEHFIRSYIRHLRFPEISHLRSKPAIIRAIGRSLAPKAVPLVRVIISTHYQFSAEAEMEELDVSFILGETEGGGEAGAERIVKDISEQEEKKDGVERGERELRESRVMRGGGKKTAAKESPPPKKERRIGDGLRDKKTAMRLFPETYGILSNSLHNAKPMEEINVELWDLTDKEEIAVVAFFATLFKEELMGYPGDSVQRMTIRGRQGRETMCIQDIIAKYRAGADSGERK
ncbi:hypothetical protein IAR50_002952 [Cryptococcus sp. DSM 104548]